MKKRIIALTVAIMMMLSSVALASDWVYLGHFANGEVDYIDMDSAWSNEHEGGALVKGVYPNGKAVVVTSHFYYDMYKITNGSPKIYNANGQLESAFEHTSSVDASPGTVWYDLMMSFRNIMLNN